MSPRSSDASSTESSNENNQNDEEKNAAEEVVQEARRAIGAAMRRTKPVKATLAGKTLETKKPALSLVAITSSLLRLRSHAECSRGRPSCTNTDASSALCRFKKRAR